MFDENHMFLVCREGRHYSYLIVNTAGTIIEDGSLELKQNCIQTAMGI